MALLEPPNLDTRSAEQIAAAAIAWVSGARDLGRIDSQILELREERALVEAGGLPAPVCPELTNANPSSPHTVILEALALLTAFLARRINLLPERDMIEFHRLFGIERREATPATTTLTFTVAPPGIDFTIPTGTQVASADGQYVFETISPKLVVYPATEVTVGARRTVGGATYFTADTLVVMEDSIAFVTGVTNADVVDSGTEAEPVEQALARARAFQRRGLRLVSAADLESAILEDVLLGSGIVKAFPFIRDGDFSELNHLHAGETTVVVMTPAGSPVTDEVKATIVTAMQQAIGAQFIYVKNPDFRTFSVAADIKIESIAPQTAIKAGVEKNLRAFYATRKGNFGRPILRSEIIAIIEGTEGVDRIASDVDGPIVGAPEADVELAPYELPKLLAVTLNVVA